MYHFLCRAIALNEGKFRRKEFHAMKNSTGWTPCGLAGQVLRLAARGPYGAAGLYGRSVAGRALHWFSLGRGGRRLLFAAGQHANEWITTPLLMRFAGELAAGVWPGVTDELKLWFAPLVNPDGAALVTGALDSGPLYENARRIAGRYPDIAFPAGWKANIAGVDLNLQFPAGWQEARRIKFAEGWTGPAPRDYVGRAPLCAPESRALYRFAKRTAPDMVISLHPQGEVIYWKYLDIEPPGALDCGRAMAAACPGSRSVLLMMSAVSMPALRARTSRRSTSSRSGCGAAAAAVTKSRSILATGGRTSSLFRGRISSRKPSSSAGPGGAKSTSSPTMGVRRCLRKRPRARQTKRCPSLSTV